MDAINTLKSEIFEMQVQLKQTGADREKPCCTYVVLHVAYCRSFVLLCHILLLHLVCRMFFAFFLISSFLYVGDRVAKVGSSDKAVCSPLGVDR